MPITHLLEDFSSTALAVGETDTSDELQLETERLAAFEQGYSAGWEDAIKAQAQDQTKVSATLAQTLADLTFTHREAHVQMLAAVTPLLEAIVEQIMPETLQQSLGPIVVEELEKLAAEHGDAPLELVCAPNHLQALEPMLPKTSDLRIATDESLPEGQVFLRLGREERDINLKTVTDTIQAAISGFAHQIQKEQKHG
ncbi:hypothetical protein [Thalassococcus sp. S3]|uniref:hypothetical protein n=1 Tax=Thalassococcus sp. S3 TaxID=2017482 RepID=UPI0010240DBC|nr:hypothetical protein [Thalassococcus sp. S3]QBF29688.1 hypothetical protein CFI11_00465 [Thalassococcus sp. S3]